MFHRLQLHPIGKRPLAGQQRFPLQVGIHHDDGRLIVIQLPHDHRHFRKSRQQAGPVPPVARHQLISALLSRPRDGRDQHAVCLHALHGVLHGFVILDFEGMMRKGVQLVQRNHPHLFPSRVRLCLLPCFLCRKQVIETAQANVFRAAFQAVSPPLSAGHMPAPPCPLDHEDRCSCPRRWFPPRARNVGCP